MSYNSCFGSYYTTDSILTVGKKIFDAMRFIYTKMGETRRAILSVPGTEMPTHRFYRLMDRVNVIMSHVEDAIEQFKREFPEPSTFYNREGLPMIDTEMCERAVARFSELMFKAYYVFWKNEAELHAAFYDCLDYVESQICNIIRPEDWRRLLHFYRGQCIQHRSEKNVKHYREIHRVREALEDYLLPRENVENVEEEPAAEPAAEPSAEPEEGEEEEPTLTFVQVHRSVIHAFDDDVEEEESEEEGEEECEEEIEEPATKRIKKEI